MTQYTLARSHDAEGAHRRYYVDGRRVSFARFFEVDQRAVRQDSFTTRRRGDRWIHSQVATVNWRG